MFASFAVLHPSTKRLLIARMLRSLWQGALVVDFTLYLNALHWNGVAIGLMLSGAGLFGALLSLIIGVASDRIRRKPFLLAYAGIAVAGSLAAAATGRTVPLVVSAILVGFGRGANGSAGPFAPAEQAWLAEQIDPHRRGAVYSLNSALGFFGMTCGALIAILPGVWGGIFPGAESYRPLFLIVTLTSFANLFVLGSAEERRQRPLAPGDPAGAKREKSTRRVENGALGRLVLVNSFNGFAVGLTGPLISYWFARRFGVGPSSIAPVMAATFALTGIASLLTGKLTENIGVIRSVVWGRLGGLVLLVLLPFLPIYWLAAGVYLVRSALNRGTAGARQALAVSLVRDERRGLASSLNAASFQLPQAIGPTIAGALLSVGLLSVPFYAASLLQGLYLLMYARIFRRYDPAVQKSGVSG